MRLLLPVTYHGRRLAIAGRRRAWFTRAVEQLPDDHPERRIAAALCLYARDRRARLVLESGRPVAPVARDLGVRPESLRRWLRQLGADEGLRADLPTSAEREEIKQLRREVYELRRANEILKSASVFFAKELDADRPK